MPETSEGASSRRLPWDAFSDWLHAICVVTFDLELGQALEVVYPGHAKLTEAEKTSICYLAFPDSNSGCMGDSIFHFRTRRLSSAVHTPAHRLYQRSCPAALHIDPAYYFGFVYFRQVSDKTIPRGYFQKSVVVLSQLPLVRLFRHVVGVMAPEYFAWGEAGLEAACHDVDQWPGPVPGRPLALPLLGSLLHVRLPSRLDAPHHLTAPRVPQPASAPPPTVLPSVHEPYMYESFAPVLSHLQLLWELVLLGEPLVVMAPSPTHCSNVVQALVSLIWPLYYAQDYRPFFTIHDSEFKEYTSRTQPPPNVILGHHTRCLSREVILGVTNPFFCKSLQHYPHILRLIDDSERVKRGGDLRTLDSKPGVYTQYRPFLAKDKVFLKRLDKGAESMRPAEAQSAMVRRHFSELTQSFIIPLERYIASLMPLQKQISPFKSAPVPRRFDAAEFLGSLETAGTGPELTSGLRGDWAGLYRAFLRTANARAWLDARLAEVGQKLEHLHLEVVCAASLAPAALASRAEVELVDLLLKLRAKRAYVQAHDLSPDFLHKLDLHIASVLDALSPDLQASLRLADTAAPSHSHSPPRPPSPSNSVS